MDLVEEIEHEGYTIKIYPDDERNDGPREWDNLGTMVCFHRRYILGDKHSYDHSVYNSWDEMEEDIRRTEDVAVILPLYLYDHSGITMNTTGFHCRWDSGQVGFIFASKEKIRKEYGVKRITKKILEKAESLLVSEVKVYDQFIRGDVYGFVIEDEEGDEVDSCWGYYGLEDCIEQAKACVPEKV